MKITNLLASVALVALSLAFSACDGGDNTKETSPFAKEVGYAYGTIISKQFSNPQMGLTEDEKNIDKIVEGVEASLAGDSLVLASSMTLLQARFNPPTPSTTKEDADKIAFNLGLNLVGGLAAMVSIDANSIDFPSIKKGYMDTQKGESTMEDAQVDSVLTKFIEPYRATYEAKIKAKEATMKTAQEAEASDVIEAGRTFLAANAGKEGIVTTASGLQYQILNEGTGDKPTLADQVKTHYHGTLIDGTVFDSSVDRGEPAIFPVGGVIKGWQEGIPLMSVGAKYRFYIPQELAYGLQSPTPKIPAGSALIFDVELIEIVK